VTTRYLYANEGIIKVSYPGSGNPDMYMTQGPGVDDVLAETAGGVTRYAFKNMLSSVTHMTDATGAVVESHQYDSWGNATNSPDQASMGNPYGYTGREWDAAGTYYYRNRFYRPDIGRFLSVDPMSAQLSTPLYSYAYNDPIDSSDPLGLLTKKCGKATHYPPTGKPTASGEPYDPNALTAAMWDPPFNSWVKVTFCPTDGDPRGVSPCAKCDLSLCKTMLVRVNDHGPAKKFPDRIIDLTPFAFSILADKDLGWINVMVEYPWPMPK
jgi:RHS repeat-associated protein